METISNSILHNDNTIMIGIVVCCLIILAVVMIPKVRIHRKQVKQNESNVHRPEEEQKLELIVVSTGESKKLFNYKETFLRTPKITNRKPVFISETTRDKLSKIARQLGDSKMSVSGLLENMANHHLEEYKDDLNRLYRE